MRIFLDGCDGAGKSTLAKYLSERFNLDIFSLTKNSEKSEKRYIELLSIDNVIHDRTFLSEVVYPPVFGRDIWLTDDAIVELFGHYCKKDDLFIICTAPDEVIRQRIINRHEFEYQEIVDNIAYINSKYKDIFLNYGGLANNNIFLVDTFIVDFDMFGDTVERRLRDGKL